MRKYYLLFLLAFTIIGMYGTNQIIMKYQEKDSIMQDIIQSKTKYEIAPVNAIIEDNTIIPGLNGKKVDQKKSYSTMKKYGVYNESMTVLKESTPEISIKDNYDKYIIHGNKNKRKISLVFFVNDNKNLTNILSILQKEEVSGILFIDGSLIEKYASLIKYYNNNEYEVLSYQNKYNNVFLKSSISYLESITNNSSHFCATEKENHKLLEYCIKEKYHTVLISNKITEDLLKSMKQTMESGKIFNIEINEKNENELSTTIQYIKSKEYQIVTLQELLAE